MTRLQDEVALVGQNTGAGAKKLNRYHLVEHVIIIALKFGKRGIFDAESRRIARRGRV